MSRTSAAVARQPATRWKAWIWFENQEVPSGSSFTCTVNWRDEKVCHDVELSWEGEIVNDEVNGEILWPGAQLFAGNWLFLIKDGENIGRAYLKSEVE